MCLAIPGKVVEILESDMAIAVFDGVRRKICMDLVEKIKIGDFVLVHAGYAISIVEPEEAEETISLVNEYRNSI